MTHTVYDTPVTTVILTQKMLDGAREVNHDGNGGDAAWGDGFGVVVHRDDDTYRIVRCSTATYRDNTLVPFFAYYNSTVRIETFEIWN